MSSKLKPTLAERVADRLPTLLKGPTWRLSTWWPSDSKRARERSLLRLLSIAHQERLELSPLVANFAEEHRGSYRRRLRRVASRLVDGTAVVDVLEQTPDILSDDDVLTLRFATQTGTLTAAYAELLSRDDLTSDRLQTSLRQTVLYTIIMAICTGLALAFLTLGIVPVFIKIAEELQLDTPPMFDIFVWLQTIVVDHAPWWIFVLIVVLLLVGTSTSRRIFRRVFASRWMRSEANTRTAGLLNLLALSLEAGRPIPASLSTLARYHFDAAFRQRLLFARNEVEQGADVWSSLASAHLLSDSESSALAKSSSVSTRIWAMRRLADWRRAGIDCRREAAVDLLRPLAVLVFAAVLLLTATAMLGYLFHLVEALA